MRTVLFAAASLAPILLVAAPAQAQTQVTAARSTPIATSTAAGGAPDDVLITSTASLTQGGAGAAVTRDSNNAVTNQGSITATDVDNATAVQLVSGNVGRVENAGVISIGETYTASDSANADGIAEAPFAKGTGRYGIRLSGAGASGGDVIHDGGSITVKGKASYGISLESPITGQLIVSAPVTLTGDGGAAVRETAGVQGSVTLASTISALGQGTAATSFTGDVGGRLSVYGPITSTGYATTTRPATTASLINIQKTPTDLEQGGSALLIGANVAGGVFLGAPPIATVAGSTDDLDGDGVADGVEGTASVATYGGAPAVVVGAIGRTVTLGNVGTGANAYGLIVRGSISGQGVYDAIAATGLQLGVADGSITNLSGGVRVVGGVSASAYSADAVGIHALPGLTGGAIVNEGSISAVVGASTTAVGARAVLLDAGSVVTQFGNAGSITASATGNSANAGGVIDRSGRIATFENSNLISAVILPTTTTGVTTGSAIAVDLSANTTGVSFLQDVNASGAAPVIVGDVLLGSGPNTVQLLGGTVTGALQLGSSPSSLTIDNGASYTGALRYTGPALALNVPNGALSDFATGAVRVSALNVGPSSTLKFAVDPAAGVATTFAVSGAATLATGAKIGVNILSIPSTQIQTFTLVSSPQLSLGTLDTSQVSSLPFLFTGAVRSTGTSILLDLQRRSASDLGLDASAGAALDVVSAGVNRQSAVQAALLAQTNATDFSRLYNQLLPDRSDGVFRLAEQTARAIGEATGGSPDSPAKPTAGVWMQQLVLGFQKERDATEAADAGGYGFAVGLQTDEGLLGAIGLSGAFSTGRITDQNRPLDTNVDLTSLEGGVYWKATLGGLRLDARAAGGYLFLNGTRGVSALATASSAALIATSNSDRNGYTLSGRVGAAYELDLGRWFVRPQAHYDFFRLSEDAYVESGGGAGLDLSVASRTGEQSSATGSLVFGAKFGSTFVVRPAVEVGVRDVFSGDAGDLVAGYAAGGATYRLIATPLTGTLPTARLSLKGSSEFFEIGVEAGAEAKSKYREGDVRGTVKLLF